MLNPSAWAFDYGHLYAEQLCLDGADKHGAPLRHRQEISSRSSGQHGTEARDLTAYVPCWPDPVPLDTESVHFGVADCHDWGLFPGVKHCFHDKTGRRGGAAIRFDSRPILERYLIGAAPVHRFVTRRESDEDLMQRGADSAAESERDKTVLVSCTSCRRCCSSGKQDPGWDML